MGIAFSILMFEKQWEVCLPSTLLWMKEMRLFVGDMICRCGVQSAFYQIVCLKVLCE